MSSLDATLDKIFRSLDIGHPILLGEGAVTLVYGFDHSDKVAKVNRYPSTNQQITKQYLQKVKDLYALFSALTLPFDMPEIYEVQVCDGIFYTIEKRLSGQPGPIAYQQLDETQRRVLLREFLLPLDAFRSITFETAPYGQVLEDGEEIHGDTWIDFLWSMVTRKLSHSAPDLQVDGIDVDMVVRQFEQTLKRLPACPPKVFVHGDYFLGNIMVNDGLAVSAVLDVSPLSAVGDSSMDVAGALIFLDMYSFVSPQDHEYLTGLVRAEYGDDVVKLAAIYRVYYSLLFSDCKVSDPPTYQWSVRNLHNYSES